MRASRRESFGRVSACVRFTFPNNSSASRSASGVTNFSFGEGARSGIGGLPPALRMVPACATGRKPAPKLPFALYGSPRASGSTTNVGRLSVSRPRPYESHAPMHGKPGRMNPVFIM